MSPAYSTPATPPYTLASTNAIIRSTGISAPEDPAASASSRIARIRRPSGVRTTNSPNASPPASTTSSR